jgi:L-lactate dehydrogenase complex protein LldG
MGEAREQILAGIRKALGRSAADGAAAGTAADDRIRAHPRGLVPARAGGTHAEQVDLFVRMAESVAATVARVPDADAVPDAVADYLTGLNLPQQVRAAPDPELDALPWGRRPMLTVERGRAEAEDQVSLTGALAGVAETGTLVLHSGAERPTTLNFLPDTHIVVLDAGRIVGAYEDAWDRLRALGALPRTVNWITGPSRTGDIEQKIQLGAHGPRRLHIILVGNGG